MTETKKLFHKQDGIIAFHGYQSFKPGEVTPELAHEIGKELAERFIDKECIIYAFDGGHQYEGVIKEVTDGAILIEKDGKNEAINLDFVIRIREYPRNKKGKKKSVVLD